MLYQVLILLSVFFSVWSNLNAQFKLENKTEREHFISIN
jgi:hypothetical protein